MAINSIEMELEIKQGEIYWVNLDPVKGHEQAGLRPVLIMQNDLLNKKLNTVIIAPITSNLEAKGLVTTYFLDKNSGLRIPSVALLFQLRTIDKSRLEKRIGGVSREEFMEVKRQLGLVF